MVNPEQAPNIHSIGAIDVVKNLQAARLDQTDQRVIQRVQGSGGITPVFQRHAIGGHRGERAEIAVAIAAVFGVLLLKALNGFARFLHQGLVAFAKICVIHKSSHDLLLKKLIQK